MIRGRLRLIYFKSIEEKSGGPIAKLQALCPACDFEHGFRVDLEGHGRWGETGLWTFNGDYDRPTFSPSMGANMRGSEPYHPRCHSYLRDGKWQFLTDCSHGMAGQIVEVPAPDPDASWRHQRGWHLIPAIPGTNIGIVPQTHPTPTTPGRS